jgi:hypothetical protein
VEDAADTLLLCYLVALRKVSVKVMLPFEHAELVDVAAQCKRSVEGLLDARTVDSLGRKWRQEVQETGNVPGKATSTSLIIVFGEDDAVDPLEKSLERVDN